MPARLVAQRGKQASLDDRRRGAASAGREGETMTDLKAAIGTYGHTAALKDHSVKPAGVDFEFVEVSPLNAAFRRMVRGLEFDVSEMAVTTYLVAREHARPFTALPIFPFRGFP